MNLLFYLIDLLLVLDPCIMYEGLEEDFATDPDLLSHLATSKQQLQIFFNTNYIPHSCQSVSHQSSSTSVTLRSPQKVDFTSRYQKKDCVVINELDEYLSFLEKTLIHVSLLISDEVAVMIFPSFYFFVTFHSTRTVFLCLSPRGSPRFLYLPFYS